MRVRVRRILAYIHCHLYKIHMFFAFRRYTQLRANYHMCVISEYVYIFRIATTQKYKCSNSKLRAVFYNFYVRQNVNSWRRRRLLGQALKMFHIRAKKHTN